MADLSSIPPQNTAVNPRSSGRPRVAPEPPAEDNTVLGLGVGVALAGGLAGGTYLANGVKKYKDGTEFRHGGTGFMKTEDGGLLIAKNESLSEAMKMGKSLGEAGVDPETALQTLELKRKNPKLVAYKFNSDGKLDFFHKFGATDVHSLDTTEKFNTNGQLLEGKHESKNYSIRSWESHETPGQQHVTIAKKNNSTSAPNTTYDTLFSGNVDPTQHKSIKINEDTLQKMKHGNDLQAEMADVLIPTKGADPKLKTFAVEPFALSAEDRLKDLPKGLPTKFADVEGYLKHVQLKNTGIALGVGVALGTLAYLGITQAGKPKLEPTS
ncbi:MAG: hypothetical protein HEQ32_00810 [Vampirovibrio sp.]